MVYGGLRAIGQPSRTWIRPSCEKSTRLFARRSRCAWSRRAAARDPESAGGTPVWAGARATGPRSTANRRMGAPFYSMQGCCSAAGRRAGESTRRSSPDGGTGPADAVSLIEGPPPMFWPEEAAPTGPEGVDRSIGDSVSIPPSSEPQWQPPTPVQESEGPPRPNESEATNPRTYGSTDGFDGVEGVAGVAAAATAVAAATAATAAATATAVRAAPRTLGVPPALPLANTVHTLDTESPRELLAEETDEVPKPAQAQSLPGNKAGHTAPWGMNELSSARTDPPPPPSEAELRQALSYVCARLTENRYAGVPSRAAVEELALIRPDLCMLEGVLSREVSGPGPGGAEGRPPASPSPAEISRFVHSWLSSGDAFLSTCALLLPNTPLASFLTRKDYDRLSETPQDVRLTPEMIESALCKALRENWTEGLAATLVGSFYNDFYGAMGARVGRAVPVSRLSRVGRIAERCLVLTGSLETHTEPDMVDAALLYAGYELERQVIEGREISSSSICEKAEAAAGAAAEAAARAGAGPLLPRGPGAPGLQAPAPPEA